MLDVSLCQPSLPLCNIRIFVMVATIRVLPLLVILSDHPFVGIGHYDNTRIFLLQEIWHKGKCKQTFMIYIPFSLLTIRDAFKSRSDHNWIGSGISLHQLQTKQTYLQKSTVHIYNIYIYIRLHVMQKKSRVHCT